MIVDPILLAAFVPAALALVVTPGADMMFAFAQGLSGGRAAAVAASAGIAMGAVVNAGLAGLGLGALVAAFPAAFGVIRWIGVAYLLWLAWRTIRTPLDPANRRPVRPSRAFRDGFVVNVSNPVVILFLLAFVPQFVDPARPILPQFLLYGALIGTMGFAVKSLVGITAGGVGARLVRSARWERAVRWASAGVFGVLAARVAWSGART